LQANFNEHRRPEKTLFSAENHAFRRLAMNAVEWVNGGREGVESCN